MRRVLVTIKRRSDLSFNDQPKLIAMRSVSDLKSRKVKIMTWWLVTWSTYGSWLPGDPRGFQIWRGQEYVPPPKRYAKPGEDTYDRSKYVQRHQEAKSMLT